MVRPGAVLPVLSVVRRFRHQVPVAFRYRIQAEDRLQEVLPAARMADQMVVCPILPAVVLEGLLLDIGKKSSRIYIANG